MNIESKKYLPLLIEKQKRINVFNLISTFLFLLVFSSVASSEQIYWITSSSDPITAPTAHETCMLFYERTNKASIEAGAGFYFNPKLKDHHANGVTDGNIRCVADFFRYYQSRLFPEALSVTLSRGGNECPPNQFLDQSLGGCTDKNEGANKSCTIGNPINASTGFKSQKETDYLLVKNTNFLFDRTFSQRHDNFRWINVFERSINALGLDLPEQPLSHIIIIERHTGQRIVFTGSIETGYSPYAGNSSTLDPIIDLADRYVISGWRYTTEDDAIELYDVNGKLQSITDIKGNTQTLSYNTTSGLLETATTNTGESLTFTYDVSNRIDTMTDHTSRVWQYGYDTNNNLASVTNPDLTVKQYHYEDVSFPNALTGITDERGIRYATYEYDSSGRATASYHGPQTTTLTDRIDGVTIVYE